MQSINVCFEAGQQWKALEVEEAIVRSLLQQCFVRGLGRARWELKLFFMVTANKASFFVAKLYSYSINEPNTLLSKFYCQPTETIESGRI